MALRQPCANCPLCPLCPSCPFSLPALHSSVRSGGGPPPCASRNVLRQPEGMRFVLWNSSRSIVSRRSVMSLCTVLLLTPKCFAADRTVALCAMMYSASCTARSSISCFKCTTPNKRLLHLYVAVSCFMPRGRGVWDWTGGAGLYAAQKEVPDTRCVSGTFEWFMNCMNPA